MCSLLPIRFQTETWKNSRSSFEIPIEMWRQLERSVEENLESFQVGSDAGCWWLSATRRVHLWRGESVTSELRPKRGRRRRRRRRLPARWRGGWNTGTHGCCSVAEQASPPSMNVPCTVLTGCLHWLMMMLALCHFFRGRQGKNSSRSGWIFRRAL